MKRFIIVLLFLAVVVSAVVYYMRLPGVVEPVARMVPRDSCLYFSIRQGGTLWKKIEASGWWKKVSGIETLADRRKKLGVSAERQALELGLEREQMLELFGKEVGVALVPGIRSGGTLLVLTRVSGSLPGEIMSNLENSGIYRCDTGRYRGARMLLLRPADGGGPSRGVCRIGDMMAFAVSDEDPLAVLRQVVDLLRGKGEGSLRESDRYRQIVAISGEAPECCAVMYFNFSGIGEEDKLFPGGLGIPEELAGQLALAKRSLLLSLKQLKAGGGIVHFKDGLRLTLYYLPDAGVMAEASREILRTKPNKFKALKLVPSGQLIYSASLLGDARDLWSSCMTSLEQTNPALAPLIEGAVGEWEEAAGITLQKDVLPLIGKEFAYCFSPPSSEQLLPLLPGVGLIVKVKDVDRAGGVMDSVLASLKASGGAGPGESAVDDGGEESPSPVTEAYKGHALTFIPTGIAGFCPVYAFMGDFIVAASDIALMRAIVDAWLGDRESVKNSALFESLCKEFGDTSNSLTFVDVKLTRDYLRDLFQVIGPLLSLADVEVAGRQDLGHFLEYMSVVQYIYSKTETSEEVIEQVIFVKAEDL